MHFSIKRLAIASAITTLLCILTQAQAQTWPNKTVRFIVPFKDVDLIPVVMIGVTPSVIVVPKAAPYETLLDFVDAERKRLGELVKAASMKED